MKKYNNEVMLGGFIVAAGGLLAYMCMAVGGFSMTPGVHVTARFANASGLVKDASVDVAGVEVGHIESLAVDGNQAVIKLFLRSDAHIRKDAAAVIRAKSLLGEKYLELRPESATAPELQNGDTITHTVASVEVDELLASLGPLMKNIDPKDVATIVHVVAKTANDQGDSLEATVHNAAQISQQVNEMLTANKHNVNAIATHVASMTQQGDAMLTAKRPAIERTVANVDHVAGVLSAETPGLTKKANHIAGTVDQLATTLNQSAPALARNADKTLAKLPATLDGMQNLTKKASPLLDKANAFDDAKMRRMAENVLLKTGVKIYVGPFAPGSAADWKKAPAGPAEAAKVINQAAGAAKQ